MIKKINEELKKDYEFVREELLSCKRPMIFFHNDPDGLASFLLLYKFVKEGRGVTLKTNAEMGSEFLKSVHSYMPDKIFIVDKPSVSQDFIDGAKQKIIWIDHHAPVKRHKVSYINPRLKNPDINLPASYLCYKIVQQDMWISMIGCIGDWVYPDFADEFIKQYPDLIDIKTKEPGEILFKTKLGKIIKLFSFVLKGDTKDTMDCVKILTRIEDPYELLNGESPRVKFLMKRVEAIEKEYSHLISEAKKHAKGDVLVYIYQDDRKSLNGDLSNELLYLYPEKIIVVGREKSGEVRLSIRASKHILPEIINKSLEGCDGYGGGHEHAAGVNVNKKDFDKFLEKFKELVSNN